MRAPARAEALCLSLGADPNHVDRQNATALALAAAWGKTGAVKTLCAAGADPEIAPGYGGTALIEAARMGDHPETVFALLDSGADPQAVEPGNRRTALHHAASRGHAQLVERLIDDFAGTPVDSRLRPILSYARKLSADPGSVGQADVDAILAEGWDEHAVHDAAAIAARAAFMQRLVQGHGFNVPTREMARKHAEKRVEKGYVNLYRSFRNTQPETRE